jgi:hypothetical protein
MKTRRHQLPQSLEPYRSRLAIYQDGRNQGHSIVIGYRRGWRTGADRPLGVLHIDTVDSVWAAVSAVRRAVRCKCAACLSDRPQPSDTELHEENQVIYLCRWPNGDVTAVAAEDANRAIASLEEVGEARAEWLKECPYFLAHFTLRPNLPVDGPLLSGMEEVLALDRFAGTADSSLWCLYPELNAADTKIADEDLSGDAAREVVLEAIQRERELYSHPKMKPKKKGGAQ